MHAAAGLGHCVGCGAGVGEIWNAARQRARIAIHAGALNRRLRAARAPGVV